jgi:uncharacterized protein with HEPN domain
VTYRERQRLADIQAAIEAIRSHLQRGDMSDGLVFDAVRIRLLEIGEAVKALPAELLDSQPGIPWRQIARMRDHLAHRYFDTAHAILQATVDDDLPNSSVPSRRWPRPCPTSSSPTKMHPARTTQARTRQRIRHPQPDAGADAPATVPVDIQPIRL